MSTTLQKKKPPTLREEDEPRASVALQLGDVLDLSDAAWLNRERYNAFSEEEQERHLPLCSDFLIELCSDRTSRPSVLPPSTKRSLAATCFPASSCPPT